MVHLRLSSMLYVIRNDEIQQCSLTCFTWQYSCLAAWKRTQGYGGSRWAEWREYIFPNTLTRPRSFSAIYDHRMHLLVNDDILISTCAILIPGQSYPCKCWQKALYETIISTVGSHIPSTNCSLGTRYVAAVINGTRLLHQYPVWSTSAFLLFSPIIR